MPNNFWMFVIRDTDEEFASRVKSKTWPVYTYTANRRRIQKGDKVAFYKAGDGNKAVLGTAETSSAIEPVDGKMDFAVSLTGIRVWKKPIPMKPLVVELDFVGNKEQWGRYMQGGVIRISEKDYNTIASNSN